MLLAHRVLVRQVEIIRVVDAFFSADIDCETAVLCNVELTPVFCNHFRERSFSELDLLLIPGSCVLTKKRIIQNQVLHDTAWKRRKGAAA